MTFEKNTLIMNLEIYLKLEASPISLHLFKITFLIKIHEKKEQKKVLF